MNAAPALSRVPSPGDDGISRPPAAGRAAADWRQRFLCALRRKVMRRMTRSAADSGPTPPAMEVAQRFTARRLWPYCIEMKPCSLVEAHYHPIAEELVVVSGELTFSELTNSAADMIAVTTGEGLMISEGTVHRVTA